MNLITRVLMRFARPFSGGHLHHADGSLYMGRYVLFESRWLSARIHHIASADLDRDMHDHPWDFVSILLSGGYLEQQPLMFHRPEFTEDHTEVRRGRWRAAPSIARRRATDRHLISFVQPNTWSLFIYGPSRQWWGFYTRTGKIHWKDYCSVHEATKAATSQ